MAHVVAEDPPQPDLFEPLLNDDDTEIRSIATTPIRHLEGANTSTARQAIEIFMASRAFEQHQEQLLLALQNSWHMLPEVVLRVCQRCVEQAGANLGDIRLREAAIGHHVTTIVLRLYRNADQNLRNECLDVIDSLCLHNALGIEEALTATLQSS